MGHEYAQRDVTPRFAVTRRHEADRGPGLSPDEVVTVFRDFERGRARSSGCMTQAPGKPMGEISNTGPMPRFRMNMKPVVTAVRSTKAAAPPSRALRQEQSLRLSAL